VDQNIFFFIVVTPFYKFAVEIIGCETYFTELKESLDLAKSFWTC
jgi:hypothetical protein